MQRSTTKGEDAGAAHLEEGVAVVLETGGLVALKTARVRTVLGAESQITGARSVRRRTVCACGAELLGTLKEHVVESTLRKCKLLHLNGYASFTACSCTRINH